MEMEDYEINRSYYFMTWGEYFRYLENLTRMLADRCPFISKWKGVYGIPRGGSIIAVYMSHQLNLPFIEELPRNMEKFTKETCLVVDDICDSGKTLVKYNNSFTATICARPETKHLPDVTLFETKQWVVFPYEKGPIDNEQ